VRQPVPGQAATSFSRTYPGTPSQARAVRADLHALLPGCPIADDVILCASELAANATLHSRSRKPGRTITVRAEICSGIQVRLEVSDDGGPWTRPPADPDRPHGLDIITALAATWGTEDTATGRTVWALLDWPTT
jgi:serine/threonine-protein kinase RsbW